MILFMFFKYFLGVLKDGVENTIYNFYYGWDGIFISKVFMFGNNRIL